MQNFDIACVTPDEVRLSQLDYNVVYQETLIAEVDGVSVHRPRDIEDAIVLLLTSPSVLAGADGLYAALFAVGDIRIFTSSSGTLIGAIPREGSEKSVVYDLDGEQALFEDMLQNEWSKETIRWDTHRPVLQEIIAIDPSFPFDAELKDHEPYALAVKVYPDVLHHRSAPDHVQRHLDHQATPAR